MGVSRISYFTLLRRNGSTQVRTPPHREVDVPTYSCRRLVVPTLPDPIPPLLDRVRPDFLRRSHDLSSHYQLPPGPLETAEGRVDLPTEDPFPVVLQTEPVFQLKVPFRLVKSNHWSNGTGSGWWWVYVWVGVGVDPRRSPCLEIRLTSDCRATG